jgi:hypothetical protein
MNIKIAAASAVLVSMVACAAPAEPEQSSEPTSDSSEEKVDSTQQALPMPCLYICYQGGSYGCSATSVDEAYQRLPGGGSGTIYCW